MPVGHSSEEIAAQPQAGHEGGQDRGDGEDSMAEDQPQHAGPQDLIDQAGRPREEEAETDGGANLFYLFLTFDHRADFRLHFPSSWMLGVCGRPRALDLSPHPFSHLCRPYEHVVASCDGACGTCRQKLRVDVPDRMNGDQPVWRKTERAGRSKSVHPPRTWCGTTAGYTVASRDRPQQYVGGRRIPTPAPCPVSARIRAGASYALPCQEP